MAAKSSRVGAMSIKLRRVTATAPAAVAYSPADHQGGAEGTVVGVAGPGAVRFLYPHLSVAEKNSLWKIVLEKIMVFRTPEGEFSLHLYPKLPR